MNTKREHLSLLLVVAVAAVAAALLGVARADLATGFDATDSPPYVNNLTLSGQNGWTYYNPPAGPPPDWNQPDAVWYMPPTLSTTATDYEAALGGLAGVPAPPPGNLPATLELYTPLYTAGAQGIFNVDMMIMSSGAVELTSDDAFGWTFRDSTLANPYLKVMFEPLDDQYAGWDPINDDPNRDLAIVWYDAAGNPNYTGLKVFRDYGYYSVNTVVDFATDTFSLEIAPPGGPWTTVVPAGTSIGSDASDIGAVAATWVLMGEDHPQTDPSPPYEGVGLPADSYYGYNTMFFDNYAVIPEASSVMFGALLIAGLGINGMIARRRRAG